MKKIMFVFSCEVYGVFFLGGSTPSAPIQDVTGSGDHILPPPTKIIWEQQEALGTSRSRKVRITTHNCVIKVP